MACLFISCVESNVDMLGLNYWIDDTDAIEAKVEVCSFANLWPSKVVLSNAARPLHLYWLLGN